MGGDEAAPLVYRRDIRPWLPPPAAGPVVDIGCGSGALVRLLRADGYHAEGVDISPEQAGLASAARVMIWQVVSACYRIALAAKTGVLRGHIVTQNLTFAAHRGLSPRES
jgi:SAM-dependent methyltransferase